MLYGWEGNRRSGVALAMRHRLSGLSYSLKVQCVGDEYPTYAPVEHSPLYTLVLNEAVEISKSCHYDKWTQWLELGTVCCRSPEENDAGGR